jgi:hypothetical protein
MSESWVILAIAVGLYAAVRSGDRSGASWRWPLVSGAALAVAVMIRSAAAPLILVAAASLFVSRPWSLHRGYDHVRAAIALFATAALLIVAFAAANEHFGHRFAVSPSPGWYLYGRVAQFADCRDFTPPPGTRALCQGVPAARRPSAYDYMFTPQSPAVRRFGGFGRQDTVVGGWSRRALVAQPVDFLATAWSYLRSYYVPGSLPARLKGSTGLDPQLDFTATNFFEPEMRQDLERFYAPFTVHPKHWGLQLLHDFSGVVRFGGTLLFITTLLVLVGLLVGPRRSRIGVFLFGVGGLSLILIPASLSTYSGRYTVPMAAPMMTAAGMTLLELWRLVAVRRGGGAGITASTPA